MEMDLRKAFLCLRYGDPWKPSQVIWKAVHSCVAGADHFPGIPKTEYLYTDKQAKELFKRKINEFLTDLEQKGVQIIEKDVKIQKDTAGYTAKGTFRVKGNAVERVFLKDTGDQSAEE